MIDLSVEHSKTDKTVKLAARCGTRNVCCVLLSAYKSVHVLELLNLAKAKPNQLRATNSTKITHNYSAFTYSHLFIYFSTNEKLQKLPE